MSMSDFCAHFHHTTHPSAGEVQHCFTAELLLASTPFLRSRKNIRASGNSYSKHVYCFLGLRIRQKRAFRQVPKKLVKPTLSAALPLGCLPTCRVRMHWKGILFVAGFPFERIPVKLKSNGFDYSGGRPNINKNVFSCIQIFRGEQSL